MNNGYRYHFCHSMRKPIFIKYILDNAVRYREEINCLYSFSVIIFSLVIYDIIYFLQSSPRISEQALYLLNRRNETILYATKNVECSYHKIFKIRSKKSVWRHSSNGDVSPRTRVIYKDDARSWRRFFDSFPRNPGWFISVLTESTIQSYRKFSRGRLPCYETCVVQRVHVRARHWFRVYVLVHWNAIAYTMRCIDSGARISKSNIMQPGNKSTTVRFWNGGRILREYDRNRDYFNLVVYTRAIGKLLMNYASFVNWNYSFTLIPWDCSFEYFAKNIFHYVEFLVDIYANSYFYEFSLLRILVKFQFQLGTIKNTIVQHEPSYRERYLTE